MQYSHYIAAGASAEREVAGRFIVCCYIRFQGIQTFSVVKIKAHRSTQHNTLKLHNEKVH